VCTLHGYRLFSEDICDEYAAWTMFFRSQAFPTEKKQDFVWLFLISKKSQNFKIWLQTSQIGNPATR